MINKIILGFFLILSLSLHSENARGIRNNNAGNIRGTHFSYALWSGAVGIDDKEYLIFKRPIDGVRAIVINLKAYRDKYKIGTVVGIVSRWTYGEADTIERQNYIQVICQRTGLRPLDQINLYDPVTLEKITRSIIYYENGVDPYHEKLYARIFPRGPLK